MSGARNVSSTDWSAATTVAASIAATRSASSAAMSCSPGGKSSLDVARASRRRLRKNPRSSVVNSHDFAFVASRNAPPFVARIENVGCTRSPASASRRARLSAKRQSDA